MDKKKSLFDESPDTVELKGTVSGVTRLSKKAKILMSLSSAAIVGFIMFSICTVGDANDPTTVARQEQDEVKKTAGLEPANPGDTFKGVSDGQASYGLSTDSPIDSNSANAMSTGVKLPVNNQNVSAVTVPAVKVPALGAFQVPAPSTQPLTPEQQAAMQIKQQREQVRLQAMGADIETGGSFGSNGTVGQGVLSPSFLQTGVSSAGGGQSGQATVPVGMMPLQDDLNKQVRKENFLKEAENQPDKSYLKEIKRPPIGKYEIKAGWLIPAVLESGINSDLPGQVCARVRENVYDSRTGEYLLIPQGTKACGIYDSQIALGQSRLLLVWNRLIFADGSSLTLQGMPGADQAGYAGFDGDVDNHYIKIFGSAVLMTVVSAGTQLSQSQQAAGTNSAPSTGQTMAAALGQQLGQVSSALIQRNMQVQPTIRQAPGYRFNIMVTRDIIFSEAFK